MFDLNTIIAQALAQAIEQATKPLIERITALESQALAARLTELEQSHDEDVEACRYQLDRLETRVGALEVVVEDATLAQATKPLIARIEELEAKQAQPQPTTPLDINAAMDELNQQEWFWEKIRRYIDAGVEVALEDHTGTYDHDDFVTKDEMPDLPDFEDFVTKDELPEFPDTDDLVTTDTLKDYIDEALSDIRLVRR
jgi:hypothetical protein